MLVEEVVEEVVEELEEEVAFVSPAKELRGVGMRGRDVPPVLFPDSLPCGFVDMFSPVGGAGDERAAEGRLRERIYKIGPEYEDVKLTFKKKLENFSTCCALHSGSWKKKITCCWRQLSTFFLFLQTSRFSKLKTST